MKKIFKLNRSFIAVCSLVVVILVGCSSELTEETIASQNTGINEGLKVKVEKSNIKARPSYGATETIGIYSSVPNNWIVIKQEVHFKRKTIKYVGGAKYGAKETMDIYSKVPNNWIVIKQEVHFKRKTIKYVGGAKYGATETMDIYSKVPSGWIVIKQEVHFKRKTIKYLG